MIPSRPASRTHPLAIVLAEFAPSEDELTIDADVPLERGIIELTRRCPDFLVALAEAVDLLAAVLAAHDAGIEHCMPWSAEWTPLPAAGTHRQWLGYVLVRLRETLAAGRCPPAPEGSIVTMADLFPPRSGSFTDLGTAEAAVTGVLQAHEEAVNAWVHGLDPRPRLALSADLGRVVGRVARRVEAGQEPPVEDVTAAVVLLGRVGQEPGHAILSAHPEVPLDEARRAAHPELVEFFSAWFGQDWREVDLGSPWWVERAWNADTDEATRQRVLAALERLLALDDEELPRVVDACGSYLQPVLMRRWLAGLVRRSTGMPWARIDGTSERAW